MFLNHGQVFIYGFCPHWSEINHNSEIQQVLRNVIFSYFETNSFNDKNDLNWYSDTWLKSLFSPLAMNVTAATQVLLRDAFLDFTGVLYIYI